MTRVDASEAGAELGAGRVVKRLFVALLALAVPLLIAAYVFFYLVFGGFSGVSSVMNDIEDEAARSEIDAKAAEEAYLSELTPAAFAMIDQNGDTVTEAVFEGRWTVLAFVFTRCAIICPVMTPNIVALSERLEGEPVRFVMVSVDPGHDTPAVLAQYAKNFGMDERFRLLSAPSIDEVNRLLTSLEFLPAQEEMVDVDGAEVFNVRHPQRLVLIDPQGVPRAVANGTDSNDTLELSEDYRRLNR